MLNEKRNTIGYRIKELKTEKHISQSQLGEMLGVSQDTVSLWEKSKSLPSVDIIIKLSEIFSVSCDYILGVNDFCNIRRPTMTVVTSFTAKEAKCKHLQTQKNRPQNTGGLFLLF